MLEQRIDAKGVTTRASERLTLACHAFSTPERLPASASDLALLSVGARAPLIHEGQRLARWSLGDGPKVVLIHGWNGRATQWIPWLPALQSAGFSVHMMDLPGHGESTGHEASVVHAGRALRDLCADLGEVHAVVGHSMGAAAILWALGHGLTLARSVHLAGPSSLTSVVHGMAEAFGLDPQEQRAFAGWVERFIGAPTARVRHFGADFGRFRECWPL